MDPQKLELLEARVLKAITEINRLREKNTRLEKEVQELKKQAADKDKQLSALQPDARKLEELSAESRQLLQERDTIRLKIESLLDKLEKIDII